MSTAYDNEQEDRAMAAELREQAKDEAKATLAPVINGINGGYIGDALALAIADEHPTLSGQLAKWVAIGIMRRVTRNPRWKPYDKSYNENDLPGMCSDRPSMNDHPWHDGRFSCELVIGAELMARQGFI